jgi:microcompartment protein CcmL/EutN
MEYTVIGVLEFSATAAGIKALDGMVKASPVKVIDAKTICPGKFYIIVTGDVASVDAALTAGKGAGTGYLIDELFIPNLNEQIIPSILGTIEITKWESLGVIESFSIVSSIVAGDLAAKAAEVELPEIRLATGMAGKSYVKMIGRVHDVEVSMKAAREYVAGQGLLCKDIIIPYADPAIKPFIL